MQNAELGEVKVVGEETTHEDFSSSQFELKGFLSDKKGRDVLRSGLTLEILVGI